MDEIIFSCYTNTVRRKVIILMKTAKTILVLSIVILVCGFTLIACGDKKDKDKGDNNTPTCTIIYKDDITIISVSTRNVGASISKPADPKKSGFRFLGWYQDSEFEEEQIFPFVLGKNKTLFAKWIVQFTVNFDANDGIALTPIQGDIGTTINSLPDTTKQGVTFFGWFTDAELTVATVVPFVLEENMTLYAKWFGFAEVSSGRDYSIAIDCNGDLWSWGKNEYGQLGDGTTENRHSPVRVMSTEKFKMISVSPMSENQMSFAIDIGGRLWAWGSNVMGQLGGGAATQSAYYAMPVSIKEETIFKFISVGVGYCMAIDTDDYLWTWGHSGGALRGDTTATLLMPTKIIGNTKFSSVMALSEFTVAVDISGKLWYWGWSTDKLLGELHNPFVGNIIAPLQLYTDKTYITVTGGNSSHAYVVLVDTSGHIWTFGWNQLGELGLGTLGESEPTQRIILDPAQPKPGVVFKSVSSRNGNTYALDNVGNLWAWGAWRLQGIGSVSKNPTPVKIGEGTKFVAISMGFGHINAIDVNGMIWTSGLNQFGQLGDGTVNNNEDSLIFVPFPAV